MPSNQITVDSSTGQISFSNIRVAFNAAAGNSLTAISITAMRNVGLNKTEGDGEQLMIPSSGAIVIGRSTFTDTTISKGVATYAGKTFVIEEDDEDDY